MHQTDQDGPGMGYYTIKLPGIIRDAIDDERVIGGMLPGRGFGALLFAALHAPEVMPRDLEKYDRWLARQSEQDTALKQTRRQVPAMLIEHLDRQFPRRQDFARQLGATIYASIKAQVIKCDLPRVCSIRGEVADLPAVLAYRTPVRWGRENLLRWLDNQEAQAAIDRIFREAGEAAPILPYRMPIESFDCSDKTWPRLRRLAEVAARRRAEA